jgi:hypothetical protein
METPNNEEQFEIEKRLEAQRVIDEQNRERLAEIDADRAAAAGKKLAQENAEWEEKEWSARLSAAKNAERGAALNQTIDDGINQGDTGKQLAAVDKEIKKLAKKSSNSWQKAYLFLIIGAVITDFLQVISTIIAIVIYLSTIAGIIFSVIKFIVLRLSIKEMDDYAQEKAMAVRTVVTGAISAIPVINLLPEQTMIILREWTVRKTIMNEADSQLRKLYAKRKKLTRY